MRLVHLADLHLGYRQYHRLTAAGLNQREADVAATFARAIDQVIDVRPDAIVIAGDIFHTVRPANPAIIHAFAQFARLRAALPAARVVVIGGNHDQPRATETGCILGLFKQLGFDTVYGRPASLHDPVLDLEILAVPERSGTLPSLVPTTDARYRVLLLHGELEEVRQQRREAPALTLSSADLHLQRWSYVALGHHHVCTAIAPNAYYSGSLEYTSVNPWRDLYEERTRSVPGKGFLEVDLDADPRVTRPVFHRVTGQRRHLDLPPISAAGLSAPELMEAIERAVRRVKGGIADAVVRLVITDTPRGLMREVDPARLREIKQQALFFRLDARPAEPRRHQFDPTLGRRPTLADQLQAYLRERPIDPLVRRDDLVALGIHYLDAANAVADANPPAGLS